MIKTDQNMNIMGYKCEISLVLRRQAKGKEISRTKFLKEGEKYNIPDPGKP